MPEPDTWCLIFSDGTGQRGVRDEQADVDDDAGQRIAGTNVFQMYVASYGRPYLNAFYDAGLGAPEAGKNTIDRKVRDLWAKATGWGISDNIADCYEGILINWRPGMKVGLFGFSRGAYTARCVGGVLGTVGIATTDGGKAISRAGEPGSDKARRRIAEEAVAAYTARNDAEKQKLKDQFAASYRPDGTMPSVIGVFDTVESLGLPGVMDIVTPWKHRFHDRTLSPRVPVGLHALSIDENRKAFLPVLWDTMSPEAMAAGQVIEQRWFPGVHSDIGGGYEDETLSKLALGWMLSRLRDVARLHIPLTVVLNDNILGTAHDERTGFGLFWLPGDRQVPWLDVDDAWLGDPIEDRFSRMRPSYRPKSLRGHPRVNRFY